MTYARSLCKATILAAPISVLALSAQAADVVGTIKDQQQFSKLAKAIEQAGVAQSLQGEGPYTVFAPTDQAFQQLPQGALDELMKQENQGQLETLLQYHVVEGEEIAAKDALGKQTKVDTLAGDSLSVDGQGQMVLIVPTGLTVTRIGDEVIVERDVAAVAAPAVEVAPAGQSDQQSSQQQSQQAQSGQDQQAQSGGQSGSQQQAASGSQTSGSGQSDQQQAASSGSGSQSGQQQTAQSGSQKDQGMLREATVVEPDIQADNGVIHAIDGVLVPQSVLSNLESMGQNQQNQDQQGQSQQSKAKQG